MSFISRVFGNKPDLTPQDRTRAVAFLRELNALQEIASEGLARDLLDKPPELWEGAREAGGGARHLWESAREAGVGMRYITAVFGDILIRYTTIGPIPDVAADCFAAWGTYWASVAHWSVWLPTQNQDWLPKPNVQEMYDGQGPPGAIRAWGGMLKAYQAAKQEEVKLLRRLRLTPEEVRNSPALGGGARKPRNRRRSTSTDLDPARSADAPKVRENHRTRQKRSKKKGSVITIPTLTVVYHEDGTFVVHPQPDSKCNINGAQDVREMSHLDVTKAILDFAHGPNVHPGAIDDLICHNCREKEQ